MSIIDKWKAAYLYGRALARFHAGRYGEAVKLFETVCTLDPADDDVEICHAYLGRSYLAIGEVDQAISHMRRAYNYLVYNKSSDDWRQNDERSKLLSDYSRALKKAGRFTEAEDVDLKAETMLQRQREHSSR